LKQSEERVKNEAKEKVGKDSSTKSKPSKKDSSEEEEEPNQQPKKT